MKKPHYELYEVYAFQPEPEDVRLVDTASGPQLEWDDEDGQKSVLIIPGPTTESLLETRNALVGLINFYAEQRAAIESYLDGLSEE